MNVGTEVEISIGHRLMDYEGLCQHPHGHNYRIVVDVTFPDHIPSEAIPERGMYIDFKDLRKCLNNILEPLDHSMMLREDDPLVLILLNDSKARINAFSWNPTAENFAVWLRFQLSIELDIRQQWIKVKVYETSKSYAEV